MTAAGSSLTGASRGHFVGLDGLRGFAAFCIVLNHVFIPIGLDVAPNGYLAVDFFFVLSGFVVANAYERRLLGGLTFMRFVVVRVTRLYPLLLLGMTMGIAVSAMKVLVLVGATDLAAFATAAVMGLLMIPFGSVPSSSQHLIFPFYGPAWSLFFEFAVNFVYAAVLPRLSGRVLGMVIALSGLWLCQIAWAHGDLMVGNVTGTFFGGIARITFSFFAGVAIYRVLLVHGLPRIRFGGWLGFALLALALLSPATGRNAILDPVAVLVLFPIVMLLAIGSEPAGRIRGVVSFAGALSYPLYITHYPVMRVFQYLVERRGTTGLQLYGLIALEIASMFALATLALYFYDRPLQEALRRWKLAGGTRPHGLSPSATRN